MEATYWNNGGKHKDKVDVLQCIIVDHYDYKNHRMPKASTKHKSLERLRKGVNAYYRYYNDGDYPQTFARDLKKAGKSLWLCRDALEPFVDERIEAAWSECVDNGYVAL